jgi:hypothetical protein
MSYTGDTTFIDVLLECLEQVIHLVGSQFVIVVSVKFFELHGKRARAVHMILLYK